MRLRDQDGIQIMWCVCRPPVCGVVSKPLGRLRGEGGMLLRDARYNGVNTCV